MRSQKRHYGLVLALTVLLLSHAVVLAAPVSLVVNGTTGTIMTGNPCPSPRTSATYKHIQAAITCAESGDSLVIAAGVYPENLTITKDLILQGTSAATTTINGGGVGRVLTVTGAVNVALSGLKFTNGIAADGGGVYTSASTLTFTGVQIHSNTATARGGGLFTTAGTVTFNNSTISLNTAPNGGGVYTLAGTVKILGGSVTNNTGTTTGGGVFTQAGTLSSTTGAIVGNIAATDAQIHTVVGAVTDAEQPTIIEAQVVLEGRPIAPNVQWVTSVKITITPSAGGSAVFDQTVVTNETGGFTVTVTPGAYKIRVKGVHTLARVITATLVPGTNIIQIPPLLEGDGNDDNLVNILDFSLLATSFGKLSSQVGFNPLVDFNDDDLVNILDFSLLATNFAKIGEVP